MAKTPSKKLFNLIKSLSASERRYFKVVVNPSGDKNNKYAQLFDAICVQEEFDDQALQQEIYGKQPIQSRKFSELKSYLFNQVLKSLQSYDEKSSIHHRMNNMLANVRVLFKRSLFFDAQEELQKAKKIGQQYELYDALLHVAHWEKEIAYTRTDIEFLNAEIDRIQSEEIEYLTLQKKITTLRNLFFKLLIELRKNVSHATENIAELESILPNSVLFEKPSTDHYRLSVSYFRLVSVLQFAKQNMDQFYKMSQQLITIMESRNHFLEEDVSEYISALSNHLVSCGKLEKYAEVDHFLQKIKNIKPITADDELKIHRQYFTNMFSFCITTGQFEKGKTELLAYQKTIEKYTEFAFFKSSFFFQHFYIYFGNADYETAIDYLNQWLNQPKNVERKDLQALARVLNLLVHFELGNATLLESLVPSTRRYLKNQKVIYAFETDFMHFVLEMQKPMRKKQKHALIENLLDKFSSHIRDPKQKRMLELFDFLTWLSSKLKGISFEQAMKAKMALHR